MLNSVGLQGPGVDGLAAPTSCPRCWPPAPGWWPASGAAPSTTTPGRRPAGRRARRRSWRSRSTCRAPTSRPRPTLFAHSADGHRGGACAATAGVRPAPLGQAQPQRRRPASRSPAPPREAGAEAVTLVNTVSAWPSTPRPGATGSARRRRRRAVGPGHPPGRGAGGARRARGACPDLPDRRRRRRGDAAPTRSSCCWPGRPAVQVGTATFADPRAPGAGAATSWRHGAARHGVPRVGELIGAVAWLTRPTTGRRRRRARRRARRGPRAPGPRARRRRPRRRHAAGPRAARRGSASPRSASSCTARRAPTPSRRCVDLGFDVFVDLKLHDIPTTVGRAARVLGALGASLPHAPRARRRRHAAGRRRRARRGRGRRRAARARWPLAVTVLTSDADAPPHILPQAGRASPSRPAAAASCAPRPTSTTAAQLAPAAARASSPASARRARRRTTRRRVGHARPRRSTPGPTCWSSAGP